MFSQLPELKSVAPGIAGSLLALLFMRGHPRYVALGMFIGGCILSYYATPVIVDWSGIQRGEGLIGFLVGLFGMALMSKLYDSIEAIEPREIWLAAKDKLRKLLGV